MSGRSASRYRSAYSDHDLLDAVAEVAAAARTSVSDRRITRGEFDAARTRAGHPDLPSADRISRRLGVPFSEILIRACSEHDQTRWTARRHAPTPRAPDPAEAAHALRVAAAAAAPGR